MSHNKKFIIDANLPAYLSIWNNEKFVHVSDINESMTDSEIWIYAKKNNLVIISKDADFSNRLLLTAFPPKVIHIRIGNMRIKELHSFLTKIWADTEKMIEKYKIVNIYKDRIEGIK